MNTESTSAPVPGRRFSGLQIFFIVLITVLVTAAVTLWIVRTYVFPTEFKPVQLSVKEERLLDTKLARLDSLSVASGGPLKQSGSQRHQSPTTETLEPEPYSEEGAKRTIAFSERELNALLAKNTDLARKLAIDLSDNLVSAKLLVPVDQDFPVLGGKILKVRAGLELAYRDQRPIVILKGISIMGVPIPNAWLGGLKNIDLVEQYGADEGFWRTFSDGVEDIRIAEGNLYVKLKE